MTLQDRNLREQTLFALYINPPYSDTERALREALDQVVTKIHTTKGDWTRAKMNVVAKEIATQLGVPYEGLLGKVESDMRDQLFKLDKDLLNRVLDPNNMVQGYNMKSLFKADTHIKQMQITFAAAASRGAPVNEIVKLLHNKNNILTKNQLKSAIITTQNEARARARHESYREMEILGLIDGYKYDATLDGRTTTYCREHDGRTYWKPLKQIVGQINVHFRCRSVFIPTTKDTNVRASVFGPTTEQTYGSWFDKQHEDFQRATLGSTKFAEFKKGTYKVGGLADLTSQQLSLFAIQDLLYSPDIATKGPMTKQYTLLSDVVAENLSYPVRSIVDEVNVLGVGEAGFQSMIKGSGLSLVTKTASDVAIIHDFVLPTAIRDQGVSKIIMKDLIETYTNYGIGRVDLVASKQNGVYTWLRYGFQPTDREVFKKTMLKINPRYDTYLKEWDRGDYTALSAMLAENKELKELLSYMTFDMELNLKNNEIMRHFNNYVKK